jgi:hypothetical protein
MPRSPGNSAFLSASATGSTTPAYAAGDAVGGALTFSDAGGYLGAGMVVQVTITLATATAAELDLILYNSSFTGGTDNAAFSEAGADNAKSPGVMTIPASAFKAMGGGIQRATVRETLAYNVGTQGATLRGQLIVRGALTLTATGVTVGIGVLKN